MAPDSEHGQKRRRKWRWIGVSAGVLLVGAIAFWSDDIILFPEHSPTSVLVLDNCDSDFRTPPFEDTVVAFGPNGRFSRLVTNLNLCQTVGGGRCLGVSPDGRFFVVCENVGNRLTAWVTGYGYSKPVTGRILDAIERRTGPLPLGKKLPDYLRRTRYWPMTCKFDQEGKPLVKLSKGGHSIEIQSSDGSVWLAGKDRIHHYSREGRKLARFGGVSSDQKYIVIIPEREAGTGSSSN